MKSKKIFSSFVLLVCAIAFNFSINSKNIGTSNFSLRNINALQASAGEATCKDTSTNKCTITLPNGVKLEGTGQPYTEW